MSICRFLGKMDKRPQNGKWLPNPPCRLAFHQEMKRDESGALSIIPDGYHRGAGIVSERLSPTFLIGELNHTEMTGLEGRS